MCHCAGDRQVGGQRAGGDVVLCALSVSTNDSDKERFNILHNMLKWFLIKN